MIGTWAARLLILVPALLAVPLAADAQLPPPRDAGEAEAVWQALRMPGAQLYVD